MRGLTDKQEKLARGLAQRMTKVDAFVAAGYNSKGVKKQTLYERASRASANPKVKARVEELQKEFDAEFEKQRKAKAKEAAWTHEKANGILQWTIQKAQEDIKAKGVRHANITAIVSAVKELNELEGLKAGDAVRIRKEQAQIAIMTGEGLETEDLSEVEAEIYGDD